MIITDVVKFIALRPFSKRQFHGPSVHVSSVSPADME